MCSKVNNANDTRRSRFVLPAAALCELSVVLGGSVGNTLTREELFMNPPSFRLCCVVCTQNEKKSLRKLRTTLRTRASSNKPSNTQIICALPAHQRCLHWKMNPPFSCFWFVGGGEGEGLVRRPNAFVSKCAVDGWGGM